jgi:hypothetical protein
MFLPIAFLEFRVLFVVVNGATPGHLSTRLNWKFTRLLSPIVPRHETVLPTQFRNNDKSTFTLNRHSIWAKYANSSILKYSKY